MRARRLAAVLVAVAAVGAACGDGPDERGSNGGPAGETSMTPANTDDLPRGGVLRRATGEPDAIDPTFVDETEGSTISRLLFDGLVDQDEDLKIVPAVAREWEVSDDGLVYTFALRDDSRFTNGRAVEAGDFVFAAQRLADPDTAAPAVPQIPISGFVEAAASEPDGVVGNVDIPGIRAEGPTTLVIELTTPYSLLLDELVTWAPIPREEVDTPEEAAAFAERPVGNGPYRMTEAWRHNQSVVVERNEDHVGDAGLLDRIEFVIFTDADPGYLETEAGNLDLSGVPGNRLASARQEFGDRLIEVEGAFLFYVGFPVGTPPYDDVRLRTAVSTAIDRDALTTRLLDGAALPATGFAPPGFAGAAEESCPATEYDPERARQLYEDAGGVPGDALTAYYPAGTGIDEAAKALANDVRNAIGLDLSFKSLEFGQLMSAVDEGIDGPYGMGFASSLPSAYGFIQPLFQTGEAFNDGYSNPEVDAGLAAFRASTDPDEGDRILAEVQATLCDDLPIIPLVFPSVVMVHSERVVAAPISPTGTELLERFAVAD